MTHHLTRRAMIAGLGLYGTTALANAPLTSLRPQARQSDLPRVRPRARADIGEMIAASGLAGQVGFVIADATTGEVLEAIDGANPRPPASVTKAVTALYAIEALGGDFRFKTDVYATSSVVDGRLDGDLILAGGGDPNLLTDDLYALSETLKATGLKEVTGRFLVWGAALRGVEEIDETQLDHLGYNPAVSGLNLNFNRVHFEWKREGSTYTVAMDARSETLRPVVNMAKMRLADRTTPVYAYRDGGGVDEWSVARGALGGSGSRWLPVRYPALYAGDVFRTFMKEHGVVLPAAERVADLPAAQVIASHQSPELTRVMRDMLRFSTNLTAEAAGMTASTKISGAQRGLRTSALGMTRWTKDRAGILPEFIDHSGLGDASRISAADMVSLLNADGVQSTLAPILKDIVLRDAEGRPLSAPPGEVRAKTGTLNFVSTLAGYLTTAGGRTLTFAIFAADLEARERGKAAGDERPNGSITFNTKAKRLQQVILQRWMRMGDVQALETAEVAAD